MVANMSDENPYATPEAEVAVELDDQNDLATRGARLGGSFVDGFVVMLVVWPSMYFMGMFNQQVVDGTQDYVYTLLGGLSGFAVFLVVNGYFLATRGQTVGKIIAGTRIVSIEDRKILPLWRVVLLRVVPVSVASLVPVVGALLTLIDPLFIFRRDYRCVHDHIAGTVVVKA